MNEHHPSDSASAPTQHQGPKTSPAAVWSLVLGILSISCLWILGSIPAIILGVKGMKKANADPQNVGGKGIALAGVITGSVGIFTGFITVAVAASLIIPGVTAAREKSHRIKDINNIRQISLGLMTYAADNDGNFPEELMDMYPTYIDAEEIFYNIGFEDKVKSEYLYRSGLKTSGNADEPILLSPTEYSLGKRVVGFVGGHVQEVSIPESTQIVRKFEE